MNSVRFLVKERIDGVLSAFDTHSAEVYAAEDISTEEDRYVCTGDCNFVGTEQEWLDHLADKLADVLVAR